MPKIEIQVLADASQARRELGTVAGSAGKLSTSFAKFRAPAAAALAVVGAGAGAAIRSASDLNETVSKSQQIFGANAGAIDTWASGAAKNLGLSKQAALDSAAGFGDMFSQIGFAGDQAAKMSKAVVQTSADLGSFNNLPTADVSDRIAAAFRGEYDSLQAVIPNINAARVESEAMAATGKKTAGSLTAQEKAAAVLAIVQKDGARAMGDFARTSTGAANSQKIAAASTQDLAAQFGQKLLPAYTAALQVGNQFLGFLTQHGTAVAVVVGVLAGLAAVVLAVSAAQTIAATAMAVARGAAVAYTAVQWLLNAALSANPIGLIVLGIAALVAGLVLAYKHSATFRAIVSAALNAVKVAALAVWDAIKVAALFAWRVISVYVTTYIAVVQAVIRGVVAVALAVWNAVRSAASAAWRVISAVVRTQIAVVAAVIRAVLTVARAVWNGIKSAATAAFAAVKTAVSSAISAAKTKLDGLRTTASNVLSRIKSLFSPSALVAAGAALISGLAAGIRSRISSAVDAVRAGVQKIKNLLPGSPIKDGPLKSWNNGGAGKRLMGLLADGISAGAPGVRSTLAGALDPAASLTVASVTPSRGPSATPATSQAATGLLSSLSDADVDRLAAAIASATTSQLKALDPRGMGALVVAGQKFNSSRGGRK